MSNFYNTTNIKTKGRYGDNLVRTVHGEEAHVNPMEAYLIDTYNRAGEDFVAKHGSGTINPDTGMPEYWNIFDFSIGGLLKTGRHAKPVAKARRQLSKAIGHLGGQVRSHLKPGGALYDIYKGQFEDLSQTFGTEVEGMYDKAAELYEKSGIESGANKAQDYLKNIYSQYKTKYSTLQTSKDEQKRQFLESMEAKKRELMGAFTSATGYSYGGGGGAAYFSEQAGGGYGNPDTI